MKVNLLLPRLSGMTPTTLLWSCTAAHAATQVTRYSLTPSMCVNCRPTYTAIHCRPTHVCAYLCQILTDVVTQPVIYSECILPRRHFALGVYVAIATKPVHWLQIRPMQKYLQQCSSVGIDERQTDTGTQTDGRGVVTIHFSWLCLIRNVTWLTWCIDEHSARTCDLFFAYLSLVKFSFFLLYFSTCSVSCCYYHLWWIKMNINGRVGY